MQRSRNRRRRESQRIDVDRQLRQLLLGRHAEFLLLVDNQQPQIAEYDLFAQNLVRADQDVDTASFEVGADLRHLFGRFGAVEILDPHGEVAQTLRKRAVVLQGENRRRHQHGDLLAVHGRLERCADRHLGLAEAHVAADQPVHRLVGLHVLLDGRHGRLLVGRVLPLERRLQLVLQIAVGRKCESLAGLAFGIEGDQLARNILDGLLGGVLELLPCAVAQLVDLRRLAVARLVARNAMERMDVHEQHVSILVNQLDSLVHLAVLVDLHQPVETPHAVVDMHHIVARPQLVQLGDGHLFVAPDLAVDAVTLVAVENLMVGIEAQLQVVVHETLVQRHRKGPHDGLPASDLVKDVFETLDLHLVFREDIGRVAAQRIADHVVGQHLEILVELGLGSRIELYGRRGGTLRQVVAQGEHPTVRQIAERLAADIVHPTQHVIGVVEPIGRSIARKLHERHLRRPIAGIEVGNDLHPVEFVGRELARNVETADRVHLVAEKVDTVGFAFREGEDVHDTAAHRILARLIDEIDAGEVRIDERVLQHGDRDTVADFHGDRIPPEGFGVGDPLGQRFGIGADDQIPFREALHGVHRRRTLHHALRIFGAVGHRTLVGGGEEIDLLLVQQVIEVVHQVGRSVAVLGDEDVYAPGFRRSGSGIERKSAADQLFEVDGSTALSYIRGTGGAGLSTRRRTAPAARGQSYGYLFIRSLSLRSW